MSITKWWKNIRNKNKHNTNKSNSRFLFVYKPNLLDSSEEFVLYNPEVLKYVKKFLKQRDLEIQYSELFSKEDQTLIAYGSHNEADPLLYSLLLILYATDFLQKNFLNQYLYEKQVIDSQELFVYKIE